MVVDGSELATIVTDLGYTVRLESARLAVSNLQMAVAGEIDQGSGTHSFEPVTRLLDLLVPQAHAHPGHYVGGEVTGELRGRFVADWRETPAPLLGDATLLAGRYTDAILSLDRVDGQAGLSTDDPLWGHTAMLTGSAARDSQQWIFEAVLDAPTSFSVDGVAFSLRVTEDTRGQLGLRLRARRDSGESQFDGIDFEALDTDADRRLVICAATDDDAVRVAAIGLEKRIQAHDSYELTAPPPD